MKKLKTFDEFLYEGKGEDLAKDLVNKARAKMKKLSDEEVEEFRNWIAQSFDLKLDESMMSDIHMHAEEAKDFEDFLKRFLKADPGNKKFVGDKESKEMLRQLYDDMKTNESVNEAKINDLERFSEIFEFETKMPFGLPKGVMDFYVKRADGKIGTYIWNDFEELIRSNPGIKFGSFANSSYVNIYEGLKDGRILVMKEVHVIK